MTNCPNCGAPYALNSRVCEYCGTARESAQEQERHDNIDPCTGAYIRYEFSGLSGYFDPLDPSQQIACGTQAIANAASNMTCNLQQAQINIEQAQLNAAQSAQCNNIKISVGSNNSIVNSSISTNKNFVTHGSATPALKRVHACKARLIFLTLFFPFLFFACFNLAQETSIVGKILGWFLLPLWYFLGYIINVRDLRRCNGAK